MVLVGVNAASQIELVPVRFFSPVLQTISFVWATPGVLTVGRSILSAVVEEWEEAAVWTTKPLSPKFSCLDKRFSGAQKATN